MRTKAEVLGRLEFPPEGELRAGRDGGPGFRYQDSVVLVCWQWTSSQGFSAREGLEGLVLFPLGLLLPRQPPPLVLHLPAFHTAPTPQKHGQATDRHLVPCVHTPLRLRCPPSLFLPAAPGFLDFHSALSVPSPNPLPLPWGGWLRGALHTPGLILLAWEACRGGSRP